MVVYKLLGRRYRSISAAGKLSDWGPPQRQAQRAASARPRSEGMKKSVVSSFCIYDQSCRMKEKGPISMGMGTMESCVYNE